ncbi:Cut9-interacting protein scn1 [Smittium culicis]|uniref:Cut9-interacting protein scn1 n=1 Tax=Smittium culicis TaxID=133412 RepID=A0A1R1WYB5_9FUNG|nr:Cut9-interacting protein scn1 [Smittium culicis]OMJ13107.1 Cut9-interacting protein scn1 [Smittium culicis]
MFDVHAHIQNCDSLDAVKELIENDAISGICLMGTCYSDLDKVRELAIEYPKKVIPAFGIHPYFANEVTAPAFSASTDEVLGCEDSGEYDTKNILLDFESRLLVYLNEFPGSVIGEIGLDKVAVDRRTGKVFDYSVQKAVFDAQFRIASKLNKPVSLHCVKAHQDMYDYLSSRLSELEATAARVSDTEIIGSNSIKARSLDSMNSVTKHRSKPKKRVLNLASHFPSKIMLHSYSGSAELAKRFLKLPIGLGNRIYFSFSQFVNMRSSKLGDTLMVIPQNRILLESDLEDPRNVYSSLLTVHKWASEKLCIPQEEMLKISLQNSADFFSR